MKIKSIRCKSGLMGWQAKLRSVYDNFSEFLAYCENYNIHQRLGYKNPQNAWRHNPTITGSVNPSDFQKVA